MTAAQLTSVRHHPIHVSTVDQNANLVLLKELSVERNDRGQQVCAGVGHLAGALTPPEEGAHTRSLRH